MDLRPRAAGFWLAAALALLATSAAAAPSFITFETGLVRPLALSPDGTRLFAVNAPDDRLEVFDVGPAGIAHASSIPVGLEPCAVAARTNDEVWVVNHLSDSVSIVSISQGRVLRTLLVGDEPRDIVITDPDAGGVLADRVFVTTAHRGQQRNDASLAGVPGAGPAQFNTAGTPRADVWVFDADNLGSTIGGTPLGIVQLFTDTPRALAVSADGTTVYAAGFHTGNQTTTVSEGAVCNGFGAACGNPGPSTNSSSEPAPEVGLIVQYSQASGHWEDELGRNWDASVKFDLPDTDVFAIDATTLSETTSYAHVGTILFNMVVNPNGNIYVSNTEALNRVRFEGPGTYVTNGGLKTPGEPATVQGHLHEARITVIDGGTPKPRHLNPHIDYGVLPAPAGVKDHSLATPVDMVLSGDGATLYVAAFGSSKVGVFATADLENDQLWDGNPAVPDYDPTTASASYLDVSGGGPAGLALDELRDRLYVLTRFDNSISVIDLGSGSEAFHVAMPNPEPASVVEGRPFLYDAFATSSNGEASCASCHVFGDLDSIAWDLGNPDDVVSANPIPINLEIGATGFSPAINGTGNTDDFSSMKGPMTTQTLRGLVNSGAQHWRGDRSNGFFGVDAFDSDLSFRNFIVAFSGLVGGDTPPGDLGLQADMQKFADFALQITLPPNPVRALDNSLTAFQQSGKDFFTGTRRADGLATDLGGGLGQLGFRCEGCHRLDPSSGFFGTGGNASFENETQIVKIPHLRNLYQKVGMFGMPAVPFFNAGDNGHKGPQIRGFGYLHDGSTDTLFRFFQATVFNDNSGVGFPSDLERLEMTSFMLAFDSDLPPIVGQQVTLDSSNGTEVNPRIDLLIQRADALFTSDILGAGARECDVVAKATVGGAARGWVYAGGGVGTGSFDGDDGTSLSDTALRGLVATEGPITFTCVPFGSGERIGINRDLDNLDDALDNCPALANNGQGDVDTDGVGDVCDNCAAAANAGQEDTDVDGVGNVCDNQCPGIASTTLASVLNSLTGETKSKPNRYVDVTGTGFTPTSQVWFSGTAASDVIFVSDTELSAKVPILPPSAVEMRVENLEGCRSLESVVFTILGGSRCGLLGIEPFLVLGLGRLVRRRRRGGVAAPRS